MPRHRIAPPLVALALLASTPGAARSGVFGLIPEAVSRALRAAGEPATVPVDGRVRARLAAALRDQPGLGSLDRHRARSRLSARLREAVAPVIFVVFEGTGAFVPRYSPALLALREVAPVPMSVDSAAILRELAGEIHGEDRPVAPLLKGPLRWLLAEPELAAGGFVWRDFPSEEVEAYGGVSAAVTALFEDGLGGAVGAADEGEAPGHRAARSFLFGSLTRARAAGVAPRVVVLGHSSGGRAAVKFVESLRRHKDPRDPTKTAWVDLVITYDPVKEAHHAALEVPAGGIASRRQPDVLYKPANARRWVSVYQTVDTASLSAAGIEVGIHGSPIDGADRQRKYDFESDTLDRRAHMTWWRSPRLREEFGQEVGKLTRRQALPAPPPPTPRARAAGFFLRYLEDAGPEIEAGLTGGNLDFLMGLTYGRRDDAEGLAALDRALAEADLGDRRLRRLTRRWIRYSRAGRAARARQLPGLLRDVRAARRAVRDFPWGRRRVPRGRRRS